MRFLRASRGHERLALITAVVAGALFIGSLLSDGLQAEDVARISFVTLILSAIWLGYMLRANPRTIREHDYRLGYEQGRRDEKACRRRFADEQV